MSEGKHTPGPWNLCTFVDNRLSGSDHHTYKVTPQRGIYGSLFEADARLIAAAPDLLEALITALPYIEAAEEDEAYKPGAVAKVTKQVRAAISRATGEQP